MYDFAVMGEWLAFAVRWLHVITAIAWIGSSFYFIALDLSLKKVPHLPPGASGEEWQVHGGGFYHIQKYLVAPETMPEHLTWFKWESYATWLSGFALMILVYYGSAGLYLVDPAVMDISIPVAIILSLASLGFGWLAYDFLCKSKFGDDNRRLMILLYIILVAMAWGYTQIFTGRAAFLHLGAFTATIMTANVFLIIMPNQRVVVADLKAGRTPDPKYGKIAKQRSTHNNYLTLPVIFLMLSNHNALAFATDFNWIIASLVFLMGVTIRHYFNTMHAGGEEPRWTFFATTILFFGIIWLSSIGSMTREESDENASMTSLQQQFASAEGFDEATDAVLARCSMCHAVEPAWEGIIWPPKGVVLETQQHVAKYAREIYLQSGRTHAMPPANVSYMEDEERQDIVRWYETAIGSGS